MATCAPTRRLIHVPTLVSVAMLAEEDNGMQQAASRCPTQALPLSGPGFPTTPDAGEVPVGQAVGMATLPLYLYNMAGAATASENDEQGFATPSPPLSADPSFTMGGSDDDGDALAVPDHMYSMRPNDSWADLQVMLNAVPAGDKPCPWGMNSKDASSPAPMFIPASTSSPGMRPASAFTDATVQQSAQAWFMRGISDDGAVPVHSDSMARRSGSPTPSSAPSRSCSMMSADACDIDSDMSAGLSSSLEAMARVAPATPTTLDTTLTALWDDCEARGLFRYNVSACSNRVVPGRWGWVAQLNEGRSSKKRPTELRADAVLQPFDNNKFNFGKAYMREALMQFEALPETVAGGVQGWAANASGARLVESSTLSPDPSLVMINVSPIDYGHVLLLPRVLACQPQRLHAPGLAAALAFIREVGNPSFRLGYNSLGAYATINHLHFQGYYQAATMPCQRAATTPVPGLHHPTLRVATLADYPVRGWVIERRAGAGARAEADMVAVLAQMAEALQALDQPFNVLFVEQGARAFVWPQCYAERQAAGLVPEELLDTGVNPAVFEVAGHLVLKRAQDFAAASDEWAARLLAGVSLPEDRFQKLTARVVLPAAAAPVSESA